jgi:hypothetical protein
MIFYGSAMASIVVRPGCGEDSQKAMCRRLF